MSQYPKTQGYDPDEVDSACASFLLAAGVVITAAIVIWILAGGGR